MAAAGQYGRPCACAHAGCLAIEAHGDCEGHYIARSPYCISSDSPQKGNGFEISVPRCLATANSVGAFISSGEWRLPERLKQPYRFAEADDRSGIPPRRL
jgi:hypothetical protein